jgi:hypothetical protein
VKCAELCVGKNLYLAYKVLQRVADQLDHQPDYLEELKNAMNLRAEMVYENHPDQLVRALDTKTPTSLAQFMFWCEPSRRIEPDKWRNVAACILVALQTDPKLISCHLALVLSTFDQSDEPWKFNVDLTKELFGAQRVREVAVLIRDNLENLQSDDEHDLAVLRSVKGALARWLT